MPVTALAELFEKTIHGAHGQASQVINHYTESPCNRKRFPLRSRPFSKPFPGIGE